MSSRHAGASAAQKIELVSGSARIFYNVDTCFINLPMLNPFGVYLITSSCFKGTFYESTSLDVTPVAGWTWLEPPIGGTNEALQESDQSTSARCPYAKVAETKRSRERFVG